MFDRWVYEGRRTIQLFLPSPSRNSLSLCRSHSTTLVQPVLVQRKIMNRSSAFKVANRKCFVFVLTFKFNVRRVLFTRLMLLIVFSCSLVYTLYFIASWFISYRLDTSCRPQIRLSLFFSPFFQTHVEYFSHFFFFAILFRYFHRLRTHCYYHSLCAADRNAILRISRIHTRMRQSMITNK